MNKTAPVLEVEAALSEFLGLMEADIAAGHVTPVHEDQVVRMDALTKGVAVNFAEPLDPADD